MSVTRTIQYLVSGLSFALLSGLTTSYVSQATVSRDFLASSNSYCSTMPPFPQVGTLISPVDAHLLFARLCHTHCLKASRVFDAPSCN